MSAISVLTRIKALEEHRRISLPTLEGWLFLPTLRARDVVFLSIGVTLAVIASLVGLLLGGFMGYWNCIIVLMMFLTGLTPWLMEALWERIRR
jgi:hypothetical protein